MRPDRVIELRAPVDVEDLVDPWRDLVARTGGSYFELPDWTLSWWRTVAQAPPTTIAVWDGPDGPDAIAALSRVRSRLHPRVPVSIRTLVNTGAGIGAGDHLGFAAVDSRRAAVDRWVDSRRGGSLVLSNIAPGRRLRLSGRRHIDSTTVCPRLPIGPDHAIGRSASYRRQVRAKVRKARDAGVTFRYLAPGTFDGAHLDVVMDLHERRWAEREDPTSFVRERLPLHRALIRAAGPGRGPAAVLAEHDGTPIGVVYGFIWAGVFSFFQSGWDPRWAHLGLGTVVHAVAFELLAEQGVGIYDFLRGDEEYKYRFGATDVIDSSVVVPRGPGGLVLLAKHRLRARAARTDPEEIALDPTQRSSSAAR